MVLLERWWPVWPILGSTGEEASLRPRASRSFWEKGHLIPVLKNDELDLARQRREKGHLRQRKQ